MVQNASGRVTAKQPANFWGGWLHSAPDLEGGFKKKLKKNRTLGVMSVTFAECENSTLKIIESKKKVWGRCLFVEKRENVKKEIKVFLGTYI